MLGQIGANFVVAHRKNIIRCSPEQLRLATSDERAVAEFDQAELLGIKTLLEKGQFPKNQFQDIVPEGIPPNAEVIEQHVDRAARTAAEQQDPSPVAPERADADEPMAPPPADADIARRPRTEDYGPLTCVNFSMKSSPP